VDAIVAEDIGKLPDVTVSDTAARIPGVQVDRAGGEANRVLIRGLPDVITTYNGREIFTAEARFVALQDFPAGGIAALEVFKSSTAPLVEGGLAGLVNVRSRRPFDFNGLEIAGSIRAQYASQSNSYAPNGNLLLSNRWETGLGEIGALINFSYTKLHFLDSARFNGGFIEFGVPSGGGAFRRARPELGERERADVIRFPDAVGIFYGEGIRERPSVNGSIQWKPNPDLQFYFDGLYQGFRNRVSDRRLFVPLFGDGRFTNVVLGPGPSQVQSLTADNVVAPFLFQGATTGETDTYQFAVGGVYDSGPLRVSADIARTDSKFTNSIGSFDTFFVRNPTVDVNFNVPRGPGGVEFSFRNFDTNDVNNFNFGGFFEGYQIARGDDYQARLDVEYETGFSVIPEISAGLRFADRDGSFEDGFRFGNRNGGRPLSQIPLDLRISPRGFRGSDIQPVRTWVTPRRQLDP
jgi:TonB-dependent receptor